MSLPLLTPIIGLWSLLIISWAIALNAASGSHGGDPFLHTIRVNRSNIGQKQKSARPAVTSRAHP